MNYPSREEFERLAEGQRRLEEEVRQLKERQTEEIKVTVERPSKEVLKRLDALEQGQQRLEQSQQRLERDQEAHFNALSQRIVDEGNEIVERVETLLIKYLKPSGNGH